VIAFFNLTTGGRSHTRKGNMAHPSHARCEGDRVLRENEIAKGCHLLRGGPRLRPKGRRDGVFRRMVGKNAAQGGLPWGWGHEQWREKHRQN
jgi:hypothetical protein